MLRGHVRVVVPRYDLPAAHWRSFHWWVQNILSLPLSLMIQNSLIDTKLIYFLFHSKENFQKNLSNRCCRIEYNGSPSKNSDIKTPLVVSFSLGVIIHFSPLAVFSCQGSSNNSPYLGRIFEKSWGFFVSVLFCFMNEEVKKEVKRFIRQTFLKVSTLLDHSISIAAMAINLLLNVLRLESVLMPEEDQIGLIRLREHPTDWQQLHFWDEILVPPIRLMMRKPMGSETALQENLH